MGKFYCAECHGTNITVLAWVDANTHKYDSMGPGDDIHCDDCDKFVKSVTGTEMKCIDCHGSGMDSSSGLEDCAMCGGKGTIIDFD